MCRKKEEQTGEERSYVESYIDDVNILKLFMDIGKPMNGIVTVLYKIITKVWDYDFQALYDDKTMSGGASSSRRPSDGSSGEASDEDTEDDHK